MNTVLLMSGLDIEGKSSFTRQLACLGRVLNQDGVHVVLGSVVIHGRSGICQNGNGCMYEYRVPWIAGDDIKLVESFLQLIRKTNAGVALLLGYPDQFPFLRDDMPDGFPCFLWAQFSKSPGLHTFRNVLPVALTPKSRDFIVKAGFPGPCPIIPHGVDTSVYFPLSADEQDQLKRKMGLAGSFVVGTVGAHTSRKRFDTIVEAFSIFSERVEHAFLMVKTDRVRSLEGVDLGRIIVQKGVAANSKIIADDLSDEQMRNLYGVMDLYLTLSEWEGFCIPVIEAMSCGVPVVTHPVQGPGEIVPYDEYLVTGGSVFREGETALLRADPIQAVRVMEKIFREPELNKKLRQRGLDEVCMKYDMRIVAGLWEDIIEKNGL